MSDPQVFPSLYIGPMSKNIVDAVIRTNLNGFPVGLIASRRQVDHDGGYVNNWTTECFVKYVKSRCPSVLVCRDHGGPNQGIIKDDGMESIIEDAKLMDIIHVDPWKDISDIEEGWVTTSNIVSACADVSSTCRFEVGTEEAIYPMSSDDLNGLLSFLKDNLGKSIFDRIDYAVVQSGTRLQYNQNIGSYNSDRLKSMLAVCSQYGLKSKEHNGDYLSKEAKEKKFKCGLDAINIAPEFAVIETDCILEHIGEDKDLFDHFFELCLKSGKWEKWVEEKFDPLSDRERTIRVSGHYVFSHPDFDVISEGIGDMSDIVVQKIEDHIRGENQ